MRNSRKDGGRTEVSHGRRVQEEKGPRSKKKGGGSKGSVAPVRVLSGYVGD